MKNALLSALWLACGLGLAFYLEPIIEDGIRAAFGGLLTAYRWIAAHPDQFTFFALLAFAILMVVSVNRANAPQRQKP